MGTRHILPLLTGIIAGMTSPVLAEPTLKKEIDVSFAPLEKVKPILEPVLSPQGKFLMLANKGTVLVIDTPGGILAAGQAIAAAQFPPAEVALEFQFVTGLPSRKTSITVGQEVPFPTAFAPPTIMVGPNGTVTGFVPATPTEFRTRNIGVTSESVSTVNPDGSIQLIKAMQGIMFLLLLGSTIPQQGTVTPCRHKPTSMRNYRLFLSHRFCPQTTIRRI